MTRQDRVKKCQWLFEMLILEGPPMRVSELVNRTGIDTFTVHDCIWNLIQNGKIRISAESYLEPACQLPPTDWYCTRKSGHEGPCAAHPVYP